MRKRVIVVILFLLFLLPSLMAQQPPTGIYVTTADSLRLSGDSDWEIDVTANLHNGTKLITNMLGGNGEWASGMGISGTSITTGTLTAVSTTTFQVTTTGTTGSTSTTLTAIPTADCLNISANMAVIVTSAGAGSTDIPANDYTTGACSGGSVTINAATGATGHAGLTISFTPAALMSNNATADTTESAMILTYATALQYSANCDIVAPGSAKPTAISTITLNPATTHPTTLTTQTTSIATEGWLRNCAITVTGGNPANGSSWAALDYIRSSKVQQRLVSGSITTSNVLTYPGGPIDPIEKTCRLMVIGNAEPAAGRNETVLIPAGVSWELIAGAFELSTLATMANRIIVFGMIPREGVYGYETTVRSTWQGPNETALFQVTQSPTTVALDAGVGIMTSLQIPSLPMVGGAGASYVIIGNTVIDSGVANLLSTDQIREFQGHYRVCLAAY